MFARNRSIWAHSSYKGNSEDLKFVAIKNIGRLDGIISFTVKLIVSSQVITRFLTLDPRGLLYYRGAGKVGEAEIQNRNI